VHNKFLKQVVGNVGPGSYPTLSTKIDEHLQSGNFEIIFLVRWISHNAFDLPDGRKSEMWQVRSDNVRYLLSPQLCNLNRHGKPTGYSSVIRSASRS